MTALPNATRIAVALGLTGSAWCSGAIMSCSFIAVSALLDPSIPSAAAGHTSIIWQNVYKRGKESIPFVAMSTSAAFVYAAYTVPNPLSLESIQRSKTLLLFGGLLTVGIIPFTLMVMKSTNDALHAKAASVQRRSKEGSVTLLDDGTKELARTWNILNFIRGLFPLAAAFTGICAILF
ncbi:hypothetical protein EV368DRAFT_48170 [Lentinula lateritia]|uniref:Uncharacterized protein n=1 Tax=Lentinula aff. lateritia TaxID=2804960 RepID=A0ACC1TY35_9AGAR|nr:hypothetical protein F5876DRAFT_77737 [Lentinula aff. lateritia]KAJ3848995.1 hypothetical protein EV368DRAFT_48170 [Lentinula lateritia]